MMNRKNFVQVLLFAGMLIMAVAHSAAAAEKKVTYTTIKVTNIHCKFCAKRISTSLHQISGVHEVRIDIPKNIVYVVPKAPQQPSPKKMWEAVQSAGFKLISLSGPNGAHDSLPPK